MIRASNITYLNALSTVRAANTIDIQNRRSKVIEAESTLIVFLPHKACVLLGLGTHGEGNAKLVGLVLNDVLDLSGGRKIIPWKKEGVPQNSGKSDAYVTLKGAGNGLTRFSAHAKEKQ